MIKGRVSALPLFFIVPFFGQMVLYNPNRCSKGEMNMNYKEMIIELLDDADERILRIIYVFVKNIIKG